MHKIRRIRVRSFSYRQNGDKCDLSDFDRGLSVGARVNISVTADLPVILTRNSLYSFPQNGAKIKKQPVSGSSVDGSALVMREVNGEWPDWFKLTEGIR